MDEAAARAMVVRFLATVPRRSKKQRWVVARVQDHGDFWLFFWTTSRALWPRRRDVAMAGNYPIGVRKSDGVAAFYTVLYPFAEFVERMRSLRESAPELRGVVGRAQQDADPAAPDPAA